MEANQKLREKAAVEHVTIAKRLVDENNVADVPNEVLAVMLGRLIRGVDELNTRVDTLEEIGKRSLPSARKV
jgi:hypothetical protein